ncbi:MAG: hypothetical protein NTY95_18640, partial [Bacteroidia bacterium]|nr:hypothetical protein [Bacteroidia bacterium]
MITYILKSSLSLLFLFGLYWFLLRKEKFFVFNRFFLITSIVFSLVVPIVPTIPLPVSFQISQKFEKIVSIFDHSNTPNALSQNDIYVFSDQSNNTVSSSSIELSYILVIIYIVGVIIFLFRFISNIYSILNQIKQSENIRFPRYKMALSKVKINPHCFFNTIFINKQDYVNKAIDEDMLNHEIEHTKQWHSVDVLFVEIIRSFYWFNPILLLYRKAVILNHEYLSDECVLRNHNDIRSYSEKLLNYAVCRDNILLTSGLNHSLVLKRLQMLTKSNSKSVFTRIKIVMTLSLVLFYFFLLSCNHSNKQSDTYILPSNVNISSGRDPNWKLSKKDSLYIDSFDRGTVVYQTNFENELWRWKAILEKHKINLNEFNHKITFDRKSFDTIRVYYLELGIIDTLKDNKVTLKNAIILSKYFLGDDYWILTAQTLFHDFENYLYVAKNGSNKNYNLNTPIDKPLRGHQFESQTHNIKK